MAPSRQAFRTTAQFGSARPPIRTLAPGAGAETAARWNQDLSLSAEEKGVTMTIANEFIVVGVDESDVALDAARWAADEASRRHCELRLVHAFTLPAIAGYPEFTTYSDDLQSGLRHDCEKMLRRVAADLQREHPDLGIVTKVIYERASVALPAESAGALLTVVGSGDENRVYGVLLGSVALAVASTNPAPVAVIHRGHHGRTSGPVVVGVDGAGTSEGAIAFAFQAASFRGAELVAVHTWHDVVVPGTHRFQNPLVDPARIEQEEREVLSERLAGWADKYPDVPVRHVLTSGRAVPRLLQEAEQAQLLVVGSHGRGGFTGMLLGSTSHSLILHSQAPVVVVRSAPAE